jgi:metal-dependent amidase/aminoacylase/carboxypeptidase family protein
MSTAQWSDLSSVVIESIEKAIQQADKELSAVSLDIHGHPELGWDEHHAHEVLTALMEEKGFKVERHAYGMKTAWKATYEVGEGGRTIGFNSESKPYSGVITSGGWPCLSSELPVDALPGIGHACGHNLIGISGCAAAIGVAAALKQHDIPGKVVLLGTPAEEGGGGKTKLLAAGAYKGMDACLM